MKGNMKKIIAALCVLAMLVASIGLDMKFGTEDQVQAATTDGYTKVGLRDYGYEEDITYTGKDGWSATYVECTNPNAATLHNVEFEAVVNVSGGRVQWVFGNFVRPAIVLSWETNGGMYIGNVSAAGADQPQAYINYPSMAGTETSLALTNNDLIVNIKFTMTDPNAATTNLNYVVTLTDADDPTKVYTANCTYAGITPSDFTNKMFIGDYNGGGITLKPEEIEYTKVGLRDYGYEEDITYTGKDGWSATYVECTNPNAATLHNVEFEAKVNVSGGRVQWVFGNFVRPAIVLSWETNGGMYIGNVSVGGADQPQAYINYPGVSGSETSLAITNNDLIVNIKFTMTDPNAATTNLNYVVTLTDADDSTKVYTTKCTYAGIKPSDFTNKMFIGDYNGGGITLKVDDTPALEEFNKVGLSDYGYEENITYTGTGGWAATYVECTNPNAALLHNVEFEAKVNVSGGRVQWVFGNFVRPAIVLSWETNGGMYIGNVSAAGADQPQAYINYPGVSGSETSLAITNNDLIVNIKFTMTDPNAATTDLNYVVTLTDADDPTKVYTANCTHAGITPSDFANKMFIADYNGGSITLKVEQEEDQVRLVVGGEGTNTAEYELFVGQGDELPTGYTEDGKYITKWTADGNVVTTYDAAYTDYVAEFVDTKMLVVKQQNDGKSPKEVRFIGSLDKLSGYSEAGFVFANKPVDGELTVENGVRAQLNTAYTALNADGVSVTANQIYDDYSNYFFAYAIRKIPQGVTIYARAYVVVDGTIIYGDMSTFAIDELQ